jgi:hypothetical protein
LLAKDILRALVLCADANPVSDQIGFSNQQSAEISIFFPAGVVPSPSE